MVLRSESAEILKLVAAAVVTLGAARWLYKRLLGLDGKASTGNNPSNQLACENANSKPANDGPNLDEGVWIYFGSQSGTAEGFAKELAEEAPQHQLSASVMDMEEFSPDDFAKHRSVILVLATYGEGDPTDNAVEFFKWLQASENDTLPGVKYTVMGLGNRQYVNFNSCAKIADKEMERLGAVRIYDRGEGDDDQNIEEDFEQWRCGGLWPALRSAMEVGGEEETAGGHGVLEAPEAVLAKLPLRAELVARGQVPPTDTLVQVGGADILGKWYFNAFQCPVVKCEELRQLADPAVGKTTKHIDFDVRSAPGVEWRTADNLEILPHNPEDLVSWFAQRLEVQDRLEDRVAFVRSSGVTKAVKKPFPSPCTLQTALALYCDLAAAPSRAAAKKLASLAEDPADRAVLEELLQDSASYTWLIGEGGRLTLREFFELFLASAKIDLGAFLQLCPRQKSRPYTIASSSRENSQQIGVCVSMVQESLPSLADLLEGLGSRGHNPPRAAGYLERVGEDEAKRPRKFLGSCSTMLCTLVSCGEKLWITARPSSFRLPRRTTSPIVMIGAGTGIAPFRGFVREFVSEKAVRAKTMLIFGCTKQNEDFLYREELQEALDSEPPALKELVTAFSREQAEKVYVQHRLRERSKAIAELVGQGAYVYVCGGTAMGRALREEMVAALGDSDYVSRLQTEGRYIEELW